MNRYQFFGVLVYGIAWLLDKTIRVKIFISPNYQKDQQYLCGFWHGKQFLSALRLLPLNSHKIAVLVSPSRDGEIVSTWLEKWGYTTVRGSSRRDAVKGSVAIIRTLKQGYCFGFAIDGPLGPIYKVKPGATRLAQKYDLDIVPVGVACNRKWIFQKAWDKFELPKPFSKAVLYLGDPLHVPKDADLTAINQELERRINEAEHSALELL